MDDLVTWLRAQLDEASIDLHTVECGWHQREFGHEGIDCTCGAPERLRADIAAKRKMIDWAEEKWREFERSDVWGSWPKIESKQAAEGVLELLALPFADRPGYREEWRP